MDAEAALLALATYAGSKEVITKLLGPTADYLGGGLKDWTVRRVDNVGKIFENAHQKAGKKLDQPGAVPPKVLKEILDNGSFADDALATEYFGGVLASSRSDVPRDDRGAAMAALVGRLTTYQLRSHFFFYQVIKQVYNGGNEQSANTSKGRRNSQVFIPLHSYISAIEFSESEEENLITLFDHSIFGLVKENLIWDECSYGPVDYIKTLFPEATDPGMLIQPSPLGTELFHWAHGMSDIPMSRFFESDVIFDSGIQILLEPGFKGTQPHTKTFSSPEL